MNIFFYGTLLDPDVRRRVLGRTVPDDALLPARVSGFRRVRVPGASYPAAIRDRAASIDGRVLPHVTPRDLARLRDYEGRAYRLEETTAVLTAGDHEESLTVRLFVFRGRLSGVLRIYCIAI